MNPTRVEVYPESLAHEDTIAPLILEVDRDSSTVLVSHSPSPSRAGTIRLTEQGWDDLVQRVNEAFVAPVDTFEDGLASHASQEMVDALSELPTETLIAPAHDESECCYGFCKEIHECSNCGLDPRRGHDPNCIAW